MARRYAQRLILCLGLVLLLSATAQAQDTLSVRQDTLSLTLDTLSVKQDALSVIEDTLSVKQDTLVIEADVQVIEADIPGAKSTSPVAKEEHSPKKAALLSIVPGLGQIYNGKWWKVPIIYAGFGGIGYLIYDSYSDYSLFLMAYKIKTGDLDEGVIPSEKAIQLADFYQASQLQSYKNTYRRNFELCCIIAAAWYALNIVDAIVDGHLYSYDISDDLSLHIDPTIARPSPYALAGGCPPGLTFSLNF